MPSKVCRYCEESFIPKPGKPGFIDECPACLHNKTAPMVHQVRAVTAEALERIKQFEKAVRSLRREFEKLGFSKAKSEKAVSDLIQDAIKAAKS